MDQVTSDLLSHLDEQRAILRKAREMVRPEDRMRRPEPARWSVAEVVEHLAIVERRIAGRLAGALEAAREAGMAAGSAAPIAGVDRERVARLQDRSRRFTTSEASEPKGELDDEAAWAELETARAEVIGLVKQSSGLPLSEPIAPHPVFGPWTFREWVVFLGGHDARHADQIREMRHP